MKYLQNRNRITDKENKFIITKVDSGGGINWKIWIDIYIFTAFIITEKLPSIL